MIGEDDDLYFRLKLKQIEFDRPVKSTKYKMLKHDGRVRSQKRLITMNRGVTMEELERDGLNSLIYESHGVVEYPMFTHFLIDVKGEEAYKQAKKYFK